MGGKTRIAKDLAMVINSTHTHTHQPTFVSLFCGCCVIESKINADRKILNDKHEYLIEMFKGLQQGYELPEYISEEQYKYIRDNKDEDKVLSGFVGFGCSFGGKWFGGYARNKTNTNYCLQSKKSVMKDMEGLYNAEFYSLDYKDVVIPDGSIVYADPPYEGTTGYGSKLKFNTQEFWEYIREISKKNIVFVSEEVAPEDFNCVWQKEFTRTLDVNKSNQPKKIEKLFVHNTYNINI